MSAAFPCAISSSVKGTLPCTPRRWPMKAMSALSDFAVTIEPPRLEGAGALPVVEARAHPVAVALHLADVVVEARLEEAAEDRVHDLDGEVVGRVARRSGQADGEHRLRRPRLVHQVDGGGLRSGHRRIDERRWLATAAPTRERLVDGRADRSRIHVADHRDDGATGLEVRAVEGHHVLPRDRLNAPLGHEAPVRVVLSVEHAREDVAGDRRGLVLGLREPHQGAGAQPFERIGREGRMLDQVRDDVEHLREVPRRGQEADRAALVADPNAHRRAQEVERVGQLVPGERLRPLAHHGGGHRSQAGLVGRLVLVRAAHELDRQVHEREVALLRHDELRAVGERALAPARHVQGGRGARLGRARAVEAARGRLCPQGCGRCQQGQGSRERPRAHRGGGARPSPPPGAHRSPPDCVLEATEVLCSGFEARSFRPSGTMLRTTRPWVR